MDIVATLEKRLQELLDTVEEMSRVIETQAARITELEKENADQAETIQRLLRWRFGPRTEKSSELDALQQLIALEGWTQEVLDAQPDALFPAAESESTLDKDAPPKEKKKGRRQLWSRLCPHLPVDKKVIELPPEKRFDADGTPLVRQGSECREE